MSRVPILGELIEMRRLELRMAKAAQVAVSQIVGEHDDDIAVFDRLVGQCSCPRPSSTTAAIGQSRCVARNLPISCMSCSIMGLRRLAVSSVDVLFGIVTGWPSFGY